MSNQEKDSISGSWLELELDDKLLLKIGKVGSVDGHVALPVKADTPFWPLLQFVPKIYIFFVKSSLPHLCVREFEGCIQNKGVDK